MSATANCNCPCPDPTITEIPGAPGEDGTAGAAGADGVNAFTTTSAIINLPGAAGPVVSPAVPTFVDISWASIGQVIFISDGTDWGHFRVLTKPSSTSATLTWLDYEDDAAGGSAIGSGATVSPAGTQPPLSAALPTALTDNSTGTASNTIAAGAGVSAVTIPITLVQVTGAGDVLTGWTPGFKFKILAFDAFVTEAVTTGLRLLSLNLEINSTNVTGGVIALTSANCTPLGAAIAGSAVTAANTGAATDTISIEASSVTAFAEGAVVAVIKLQNMDTADAVASLADHVNDLITALT